MCYCPLTNIVLLTSCECSWAPHDVALWDNRVCVHTATFDAYVRSNHRYLTPANQQSSPPFDTVFESLRTAKNLFLWKNMRRSIKNQRRTGLRKGSRRLVLLVLPEMTEKPRRRLSGIRKIRVQKLQKEKKGCA